MTVEEQYQGYGVVHTDDCKICRSIENRVTEPLKKRWYKRVWDSVLFWLTFIIIVPMLALHYIDIIVAGMP